MICVIIYKELKHTHLIKNMKINKILARHLKPKSQVLELRTCIDIYLDKKYMLYKLMTGYLARLTINVIVHTCVNHFHQQTVFLTVFHS